MKVRGTLVNYYFICKRAMWLESRRINYTNEYMEIGKLIHERTYKKMKRKEVLFAESIMIDIVRTKNGVEIYEIKKSSSALDAATWQLRYYLYILKKQGILARGFLVIPKENKKYEVKIEDDEKLEEIIQDIENIIKSDRAPDKKKSRFCEKCSYRDFCWV